MARDWVRQRATLLDYLERQGYLRTSRVRAAMEAVDRRLFLPDRQRDRAYDDTPLPILSGQTISAPHMCAMMLEELDPQPGHKVLEVGSGSGYHAALLCRMVGSSGLLHTVERIRKLADFAKANLAAAGVTNVQVHLADGSEGWPRAAPYHQILVTCGAPEAPPPLLDQLKRGGRLVVPVGGRLHQSLLVVTRTASGLQEKTIGGVAFVPLVGRYGFDS